MEELDIIRQLRNAKCGINPNARYQSYVQLANMDVQKIKDSEAAKRVNNPIVQQTSVKVAPQPLKAPEPLKPIKVTPQPIKTPEPLKPLVQQTPVRLIPVQSDVFTLKETISNDESSTDMNNDDSADSSADESVTRYISTKDPYSTVIPNGRNGLFVFPNNTSKIQKNPLKVYNNVIQVSNTFYPDFESSTSKRIKLLLELKNNIDMLDSRRSDTTAGNYDAGNISVFASRLGIVGSGALTKTQNVVEIKKMISLYIPDESTIN